MKYTYERLEELKKAASQPIFRTKVSHHVLSQLEPGSMYVKVKLKNPIIPIDNVYSPYFGGKNVNEPSAFSYTKSQILLFKIYFNPSSIGVKTESYTRTQWKYMKHMFGSLGKN